MKTGLCFISFLWLLCVSIPFTTSMPPPGSYYTDEAARRLVHFDKHSGECKLFGDRRIVEEILRELAASESPVAVVEAAELTAIISQCSRKEVEENKTAPAKDFPHVIYPGTKWCGTGNAAEGLDDLGTLRELDLCCRDHDLCPEVLEPGETKHNLTNDSPFTITLCECSNKFRECLKNVNTPESKEVALTYFSTGLFQCYALEKPILGCNKWAGLVAQACQEYKLDSNGEPKYQTMDMRAFE
ncbi:UNVERIFIED_CONTAM: hypothetical protein RMT77_010972 [Armadillidium vulgare]